jgi:hypothetical protein
VTLDMVSARSQGVYDPGHKQPIFFHDKCWRLLQEALRPTPVPLQRLFDVCNSFPIPRECSGRNGTVYLDPSRDADRVCYFPWIEDPFTDGSFRENPYLVPDVYAILAEHPEQPPTFEQAAALSLSRPASKDRLSGLPAELGQAIAVLLPTADVLRARLASRAFWPVFYSQQFWASRFQESGERPWLFELRWRTPRDWRWLFRRTNHTPGLRNRQRIWNVIQGVLDLLALEWIELPPTLPAMWSPVLLLSGAHSKVQAAGSLTIDANSPPRLHPIWYTSDFRCFRTMRLAVPATLAKVTVYTHTLGGREDIVGMSLATTAGETVHLGYRSSGTHSVEVSQLWGLRLAVGSWGLRAIQCITGPTYSGSPWLGSPDGVPRTERLVPGDRILALEAGLDASNPLRKQCSCKQQATPLC